MLTVPAAVITEVTAGRFQLRRQRYRSATGQWTVQGDRWAWIATLPACLTRGGSDDVRIEYGIDAESSAGSDICRSGHATGSTIWIGPESDQLSWT